MSQRILQSLLALLFQILIIYSVYVWSVEEGIFTLEGKVVGGSDAKIENFPHAVHLAMVCGDLSMICGSSVVNQLILLTASHCLRCEKDFIIGALAGSSHLQKVSVRRTVISKIMHPNFSETTLENDIALLLLSRKLPLTDTIKRVIIRTSFPSKFRTYVAGWGIINDKTRVRPDCLKMVEAPVHSRQECSVVGRIDPGMLCAGTIQSKENRPSKGDSGSALITTQFQQLGIVSFRTEPHIAMLVYTNVSYYYSWIKKTAKKLYCSKNIILS